MRDITKIIEAMLEHVPEDCAELRAGMEKVSRDSMFRAPEDQGRSWARLTLVLRDYFGEGDLPEWGHAIGRILSGQTKVDGAEIGER